MSKRRFPGVKFIAVGATGRARTFRDFDEAAGFAVLAAMGRGGDTTLDVVVSGERGARWWGGAEAAEEYLSDPESVLDRVEITVESRFRLSDRLSIRQIRERIAELPVSKRCDEACRTWVLSDNGRGVNVERCDECWIRVGDALTDEDMRRLPEAQAELAARLQEDDDVSTCGKCGAEYTGADCLPCHP